MVSVTGQVICMAAASKLGALVHLRVVGEAEPFLRPADHVAVQFVIGVLIVQNGNRVASGRELEFESCLVARERMAGVRELKTSR